MLLKNHQSGASLLTVLVVSAAVLGLIGLLVQSQQHSRTQIQQNTKAEQRDEVARTLLSYLSNPNLMKAAQSLNESAGNTTLHNCLTGDNAGNKGCQASLLAPQDATQNAEGYYPYERLNLLADADFAFPSAKLDAPPNHAQAKNCPPGRTHISCLLAGQRNNSRVGYNFEGETGELSACFPLEPVIYLNPYCGPDPLDPNQELASCTLAAELRFAYQLIHRSFPTACPRETQRARALGSKPKQLEFISLPRHLLMDFECNPGAFIKGFDIAGNIDCECRFPYVPLPGQSNHKGVLCKAVTEECPNGSVMVSREDDGAPVCKFLQDLARPVSESLTMASNAAGSADLHAGQALECSDYGWLQNLSMECSGSVTTEKTTHHDSVPAFCYLQEILGLSYYADFDPPYLVEHDYGPCHIKSDQAIPSVPTPPWLWSLHGIECAAVTSAFCHLVFGIFPPFGILACATVWIKYEYECYPIKDEPAISCTLKGDCYKYGPGFEGG